MLRRYWSYGAATVLAGAMSLVLVHYHYYLLVPACLLAFASFGVLMLLSLRQIEKELGKRGHTT
jgi:hypothetical protein